MSPSQILNWIAIRQSRRTRCWHQATSMLSRRWSETNCWWSNSPLALESLSCSPIPVRRPILRNFWACLSPKEHKMVKPFSRIPQLLSPTGNLTSPRSRWLKILSVTAVFWSSLMSCCRLSSSPRPVVWKKQTALNRHQKVLKRRTSSNFSRETDRRTPHLYVWAVRRNSPSKPFRHPWKYQYWLKTSSPPILPCQKTLKIALPTLSCNSSTSASSNCFLRTNLAAL